MNRKSPPLAGFSLVVSGNFLERQTAWLGRKDSNLRMVENPPPARCPPASGVEMTEVCGRCKGCRKSFDERRTGFVCLLCSANKPHEKRKAQSTGKYLKSLVGAPGLEPGTR
jgi:hypothetical protein